MDQRMTKFALYPPRPIKSHHYRCDKVFVVDSLISLYDNIDKYLIIFIKGQDTDVLEYKRHEFFKNLRRVGKFNSRIPRNHDQRCQS